MANQVDEHSAKQGRLLDANATLQHRFDDISRSLSAYEAMGKQDRPPPGYEANNGCITHPVLVANGMVLPIQWVCQHPDRQVDVLTGLPKEDGQCPYIMELFTPPNPHPGTPMDPLPLWFHKILTGNNAAYHTLHSEVSCLPSWEHLTEVERFRLLDDRCREIGDELAVLGSELVLVEDCLALCCHCLEVANTHSLVSHLKGRELYHCARLGCASRTDTPQLACHGRCTCVYKPGVSL
jgi:hypothetical protein